MPTTAIGRAISDCNRYLHEIRDNFRLLVAASLGLASGYQLTAFIANLFGPYLLHDLGWSKAQLSLAGAAVLPNIVLAPIAGRMVDLHGVRLMAAIGIISTPLIYLAYASMTGSVALFLTIVFLQALSTGLTTTSIVYARPLAQKFDRARGLALATAACAPALVSLLMARPLGAFIQAHGWRAGYLLLAVYSTISGVITFALIPGRGAVSGKIAASSRKGAGLYRQITQTRAFWLIAVALFLGNLPILVQGSQMGVLLTDRGMSSEGVAGMVSLYAMSVIAGRLACGLALDRWPTHLVAAVVLALPGLGLLTLASGITQPMLLAAAIAVLGLSLGADTDVMSYVVMRFFPAEIFSTVVSLVASAVALAGVCGSLILSLTLSLTGRFTLFLALTGFAALAGGTRFLLLGEADAGVTKPQHHPLPPG